MTHPLDGSGFRHTFLFKKADISQPWQAKLDEYFASYRSQIDEYEKADVIYANDFFVYEDTLMIEDLEDGNTHIAPMLVVVFYGSDWTNFIEDILAFQELFPSRELPRQNDYNYVIRDERRTFDDFK